MKNFCISRLLHALRPALLYAVLLCGLCGLCGCHGSRETSAFSLPESFDDTAPIEITFWAKNDTNRTQADIYRKAIEDFQKLYPNITVQLRLYTDYGKIYNDVITNIATGTTPNICISYPDHIATYMTGENTVVPLDALMTDERFGLGGREVRFDAPAVSELIPEFLEECRLSGQTVALPFMRSTEACYINKTYVEKLGYQVPDVLTWDFIWEVSSAATKKNADGLFAVNGQKVMIPFIYKSTDNMMIQMLRQLGADYSTQSGEILLFHDTTRELLYRIAEHASGAFSTFKISGYPANFLNAGQCIFAVDSTAGSTWMGTHAPLSDISKDSLVEFETAVRMVPQFDPEHPQMISQGPSVCLFGKEDPQEVLASWLFLQYLLTNDVQIPYAQTEGYVPVTSKAQSDESYQAYLAGGTGTGNSAGGTGGSGEALYYEVKLAASKLLLAHTEDTFVTPVFNGSASLRDAAGQLIENVTKSVRRKQTVDDAYMDKLFADVTALYRLDSLVAADGGGAGPRDLGPLPAASRWLLGTLGTVWALLLLYMLRTRLKTRKKNGARQ